MQATPTSGTLQVRLGLTAGRDEDDYVHVASCTANCTVSAEWGIPESHSLAEVQ